MPETIESFVSKLQQDGVEAGRQESERIVAEARQEGEQIVADAQRQAQTIVSEAETEAERAAQQGAEQFELAARDTLLKLQKVLEETLMEVLRRSAEEALNDEDFFRRLLHDVAVEYARQDAEGQPRVELNVSQEMVQTANKWALEQLKDEGEGHPHVDVKGTLRSAGFEYNSADGKVELTPESVAEVLGRMLRPGLREVLDKVKVDGAA
jgi:V/A-type H+-transporting ATPase subunit E